MDYQSHFLSSPRVRKTINNLFSKPGMVSEAKALKVSKAVHFFIQACVRNYLFALKNKIDEETCLSKVFQTHYRDAK